MSDGKKKQKETQKFSILSGNTTQCKASNSNYIAGENGWVIHAKWYNLTWRTISAITSLQLQSFVERNEAWVWSQESIKNNLSDLDFTRCCRIFNKVADASKKCFQKAEEQKGHA